MRGDADLLRAKLDPNDCYQKAVECAGELKVLLDHGGNSLALHEAHRKLYFALDTYRVSCNGSAQAERDLLLRAASEVQAKPVEWLWHPYLPRGKVVMLTGDGGVGKSQFALWVAAAVTRGAPFPTGPEQHEGGVLYFSNEDGAEDTIKPRCIAANVDCDRLIIAQGVSATTGESDKPKVHDFTLADLDILARYLRTRQFALVIIDPVQSYLGNADMNSMSEVRQALKGLPPLAEETNTTFLVLRHRSKKRDGVGKLSGSGSVDFTALCRSELIFAEHPDVEGQYAVIHSKSSCAKAGKPFAYELTPETVNDGTGPACHTSRLRYIGETTISESDTLSGSDDSSPLQAALDFIHTALADGPIPSKKFEEEANAAGVRQRTLDTARKRAGVVASKKAGTWYVQLHEKPPVS